MNNNIVVETSSGIRALAREALRGNWKNAVLATLLYMFAMTAPMEILNAFLGTNNVIASLYCFLVTGAFTLGYTQYCLTLFRRGNPEMTQVFYGFEKFFKALGLLFMVGLFIVLWALLLIIPGIIAAFRYSQAFVVLAENPEKGIFDCINESKKIMNGNKLKLFCLEFSFIGWTLLCMLPIMIGSSIVGIMMFINTGGTQNMFLMSMIIYVLSIGYLWLTPYLTVSTIAFYDLATGKLKPGVIEVEATVQTYVDENPVENENASDQMTYDNATKETKVQTEIRDFEIIEPEIVNKSDDNVEEKN